MKYSLLLSISTILFACNKTEVKEEVKSNKLLWAEHIQTILPLEKDTSMDWGASDFTNANVKFDVEKTFSSIKKAVLAGKIKAYANYPHDELTVKEVDNILVSWDSTAQAEDPRHPGTFVSAPMKFEVEAWAIPQIRFHEKIELDTVNNILHKTLSHISIHTFDRSTKGMVIGTKKLFDVKFNDEK